MARRSPLKAESMKALNLLWKHRPDGRCRSTMALTRLRSLKFWKSEPDDINMKERFQDLRRHRQIPIHPQQQGRVAQLAEQLTLNQ
jgi:hypothetical protein